MAIFQSDALHRNQRLLHIRKGHSKCLHKDLLYYIPPLLLQFLRSYMTGQLHIKGEYPHLLDIHHAILLRHIQHQPFLLILLNQEVLLVFRGPLGDIPQHLNKVFGYPHRNIINLHGDFIDNEMPLGPLINLHQGIHQTMSFFSLVEVVFLGGEYNWCHELIWVVLVELHEVEFGLEDVVVGGGLEHELERLEVAVDELVRVGDGVVV